MFRDNLIGFGLAVGSSAFIGSSFIIKKKGLQRAGASGSRAGSGGYGYLQEPLWWIGMLTMIVGEFANFVAYMYAPAVLVTPLGALSIIVSAVLAHFLLKEKLRKLGILGCVLCVVGSTVIVLHAPGEHSISSVEEIWELAIQPAFLLYTASVVAGVLVLVLFCEPRYGQTNIMVYIGICSVIGSLTVMSIKAIGIAIKLTLEGYSQVAHFKSWVFAMVAVTCIITQLIYLNKALDTFNTAVVSPIYYAMFTSLTILASAIMFKDWSGQSASSIVSVLCGFITVLSGTMVLHSTRDPEKQSSTDYSALSPQISWLVHANGEIWKQKDNDDLHSEYVAIIHQDHFSACRDDMSLACLVCHSIESPSHSFRSYSVSSSDNEGQCSAIANCLTRKISLPNPRPNPRITSSKVMPQPSISSGGVTGAPRLVRSRAVRRDIVRDWDFNEEL
ncbi:probable magnesium transporter nipa6 [Phtheirospermum japonicum]|uniref:Probable magnesium transporter n=1 Tax=Phtheirospermum japonicum TaxID=374723 RepID=A0A830BRT9_9LAMI|nr:probable magnesium transporter nipa6 [Phtheirospermum japonicum]